MYQSNVVISDLNEECMDLVLNQILNIAENQIFFLIRYRSVSKRWKAIIDSYLLSVNEIKIGGAILKSEVVDRCLKLLPNLKIMCIRCNHFPIDLSLSIAFRCPKLQRIYLKKANPKAYGWQILAEKLPNLTHLDITSFITRDHIVLILKLFQKLRYLKLDYWFRGYTENFYEEPFKFLGKYGT